jgi:hypothetical protein
MPQKRRETFWKVWPPASLAYAVAEAARRENVTVPDMIQRLVIAELHRRAGTAEPAPTTSS